MNVRPQQRVRVKPLGPLNDTRDLRATVLLLLAIAIAVTVTFVGTTRPNISAAEASELAAGLSFRSVVLNEQVDGLKNERTVAPEYHHHRAWFTPLGSGAALLDLEGVGRPTEVCLADARNDTINVIDLTDLSSDNPRQVTVSIAAPVPMRPTAPMGCVPGDVDGDGDEDLIIYFWGRPPVFVVGNGSRVTGTESPEFITRELVDPALVWNTNSFGVGDVDGDGNLDLLVGNYFPDDVVILGDDPSGRPPTMQDSWNLSSNGGQARLLLLTPAGKDQAPNVVDASDSLPAKALTAWTLAFGLQDLDGDLRPEIYMANDFGPDYLFHNRSQPGQPAFDTVVGDRTWTSPKSKVIGRDSFKGMGVTFSQLGEVDAPTILVSNLTSEFALQEANMVFVAEEQTASGVPSYRDDSERLGLSRSGWSWDIQAVDLDNDGDDEFPQATGYIDGDTSIWAELQETGLANDGVLRYNSAWPNMAYGDDISGDEPNRLWFRADDGRFYDVAPTVGFDSTAPARGIAVGDVNGDSLADLVVASHRAPSKAYLNTGTAGPAITLDVRLALDNGGTRAAFGAAISAERAGDLPPFRRQIFPTNGHSVSSSPTVLLPLPGNSGREVTIQWRNRQGHHSAVVTIEKSSRIVLSSDGSLEVE